MSDVTDTSIANPGTEGSPAPDARDRCIRCEADLTGDRRMARFCPRCGARRLELAGNSGVPQSAIESDLASSLFSNDLIAGEPEAAPAAATPPPIPPLTPTAALAAAWLQLQMAQSRGGSAVGIRAKQADDDVHSLMLLGYANAMYRLGWRYESGMGGGHNPQEALRCYFKAAKLGNIAALSRLAPQCVAAGSLPTAMIAPRDGAAPAGPVQPSGATPS